MIHASNLLTECRDRQVNELCKQQLIVLNICIEYFTVYIFVLMS